MKVCLQCNAAFDDDYIFCLHDGNALVEDGPEQETVVNRKFTMPMPDDASAAIYCVACGLANKAHSKFCKKCGDPLDAAGPSSPPFGFGSLGDAGSGGKAFNETVTFQPPKFGSSPQAISTSSASSSRNVVLAILAVGAVLIGVVYLLVRDASSSGGKATKTDTVIAANASNSSTNKYEASLPDKFDRIYEGNVEGKRRMRLILHLIRDQDNLTGSAETPDTYAYDALSGTFYADGSFQADGTPRGESSATGTWSGRISSDGTITGSWTSRSGRLSSPFTVNEK